MANNNNNNYYNYPPPGYPPAGGQYPPPGAPPPPAGSQPTYGGYGGGYPTQGMPPPPPTFASPHAFGMQAPTQQAPSYHDDDGKGYDQAAVAAQFAEQKVRKNFVSKVFAIVCVQMLITAGIAAVFVTVDSVRNYVRPGGGGEWVLWTSYALIIVFMLVLACGGSIRRKFPINMVLLLLFTISMAVFVGCNTAYYDVSEVAMAFGITCGVVLGITIFAMLPCVDFTMCGGVIAALSFTFLFAVIIAMFVSWTCTTASCFKTTNLVIASIGVFLASIYLLYDIQLVMGGKRVQIGIDEYVFAALNIYSDIIMIFLYILQIIGAANR